MNVIFGWTYPAGIVKQFFYHIWLFLDLMQSALRSNAGHWCSDKSKVKFVFNNARTIWRVTSLDCIQTAVTAENDNFFFVEEDIDERAHTMPFNNYYVLFVPSYGGTIEWDHRKIPMPWYWGMMTPHFSDEWGEISTGAYIRNHLGK